MSALVVFEAVEASHVPLRLSHRPERSRELVRTPGYPGDEERFRNGNQSVRYPLRLTGELSPQLSRGLWLVKWLLAIPHFIVLFFLWIAFAVVSVVAFFAILFTGRYPRGLFEFNVGVLRWSWRVGFYSYSALGTDSTRPSRSKTCPTTQLGSRSTTPSRSRAGLVLVKWWLLALPQYLVVAVFVGGGWAAWTGTGTGCGAREA